MGLWGYNKPPTFKKDAVATRSGWCHPKTGEVLVAIGGLSVTGGASEIQSVKFDAAAYTQEAPISLVVGFNEKVDVTAGATIEVTSTGLGGNFVLTAEAQEKVSKVVFEGLVPAEVAELGVSAQSIVGTIVDQDGTAATLSISAQIAALAGTREID
jgi:hypothetical protein